MKKKFKHRLVGRRRKPDGMGASSGGEGTDSTSSLPQPGPRVVTRESYDREGHRADAARERVLSTDRPPLPDGPGSVPARGSGHSGKLEEVFPSLSTPSISRGGKPDST